MVAMITMVGEPVEEDMADIGIKSKDMVIHLECDEKVSWVGSLGDVRQTQIVDQWVDWITKPPLVEELPNTKRIIAVLTGIKKKYSRAEPEIKSWGQPVKALKDLLRKRFNLKG